MIQRRQNLYLLILVILAFALSISSIPFAEVIGAKPAIGLPVQKVVMNYNKSIPFINNIPSNFDLNAPKVQYVLWCIGLFAIFAIFSFKNLKRQITFCSFNFAFILFIPIFAYLDYNEFKSLWVEDSFNLLGGAIIPIAFLILNALAVRGIVRDYNLLKSMDRIR